MLILSMVYNKETQKFSKLIWNDDESVNIEMSRYLISSFIKNKEKEGWRLPTLKELETLLERNSVSSEENKNTKFCPKCTFWCKDEINSTMAYIVCFEYGEITISPKHHKHHIRLVKDFA